MEHVEMLRESIRQLADDEHDKGFADMSEDARRARLYGLADRVAHKIASLPAPQPPAEAQPGEWVLVPREPTRDMVEAGIMFGTSPNAAAIIFQSMVHAAPQPSAELSDWPPQNWASMDGAIAWHLIDRHASGWQAVGEMMDAWLAANAPQPPAEAQPVDQTFAEWLVSEMPAGTVIGDPAWWAGRIARQYAKRTAPPSAPVGVERKYPDDGNGDDDAYNRGWNDCLDALARQPAAVDEVRIPRALADRVMTALGKFTSDEGWSAVSRWNTRATAAQDAEIEALRAEVEALRDGLDYLRQMQGAPDVLELRAKAARADRLAEALQHVKDKLEFVAKVRGGHGAFAGTYLIVTEALDPIAEQEDGNE